MSFEHRIQLLGPSYLMYGDESGRSSASAIFSEGTGTYSVPLSNKTFTKVGGMPIGGPELLAIEITATDSPSKPVTVYPEKDLSVGPYAWAVLQPSAIP